MRSQSRRWTDTAADCEWGAAVFVEIEVAGEPSRETFAIVLANGRRIEIGWADITLAVGQAAHLRAMIEALDSQRPCSA